MQPNEEGGQPLMLLSAVKQQQGNCDRLALLVLGQTAELGSRGTVSTAIQVENFSLSNNQKLLHNYSNQQHETESKKKKTKARSYEKGQLV